MSVVQVLGNDRVDLSQRHLETMLVRTEWSDCVGDLCGIEGRLETFFVFWSIVEPGGHLEVGGECWRSIFNLYPRRLAKTIDVNKLTPSALHPIALRPEAPFHARQVTTKFRLKIFLTSDAD